jgi:uracil-DNA glycosylase
MALRTIDNLMTRVRAEAKKGGFSIDLPVYETAERDPFIPILYAGSLEASLAVMGRDLGGQEVKYGEPLIGDAGHRVRASIYEFVTGEEAPPGNRRLEPTLERVLLTNTVPYKPIGNKAYPTSIKERFRPFVEELLFSHWQGDHVITLGTEAFKWFAPYAPRGEADAFWARPDRYEVEFGCELWSPLDNSATTKPIVVAPLPHPSPLNQAYWSRFPEMLKKRLEKLL